MVTEKERWSSALALWPAPQIQAQRIVPLESLPLISSGTGSPDPALQRVLDCVARRSQECQPPETSAETTAEASVPDKAWALSLPNLDLPIGLFLRGISFSAVDQPKASPEPLKETSLEGPCGVYFRYQVPWKGGGSTAQTIPSGIPDLKQLVAWATQDALDRSRKVAPIVSASPSLEITSIKIYLSQIPWSGVKV